MSLKSELSCHHIIFHIIQTNRAGTGNQRQIYLTTAPLLLSLSALLHYSLLPKRLLALRAVKGADRSTYMEIITWLLHISAAFLTTLHLNSRADVLSHTPGDPRVPHYPPSIKLLPVTFSVQRGSFHCHGPRLIRRVIFFVNVKLHKNDRLDGIDL